MSDDSRASIIINNYNYGRFLTEAIESALSQTYHNTQVIVVDDGSTDDSAGIIEGFGHQILPVLKENGGQGSAFNVGFATSNGEVVLFLDSDDMLLPTAVERAVELFGASDIANVHWPLWEIDEQGKKTGQMRPLQALGKGDLLELVVREGPEAYVTAPTTGNAWARCFLEKVFPLPEEEYRICADIYLCALAPLFGRIEALSESQGYYRLHGQNNYARLRFDDKLTQDLWCYNDRCRVLAKNLRKMGIRVNSKAWKRNAWLHRFLLGREEIAALSPPEDTLILVDDDLVGSELVAGRRSIPFLERDGQYWGAPLDDEMAIRECERLRQSGASFLVFAWTSFWWLDYYQGFLRYLRSNFRCVLDNNRLVVFDLRP
jgi:glycosyltransferase involved in cell wall biosynthesis